MFGKRRSTLTTPGKIDNVLGTNTSFNGTIKSDGNIRIDGDFQGAVETAGNVIVGPSAQVLADIRANSVQVWGAVRGNILAQGRLEILPDGRVWGDIQVGSLMIDGGGMFRGQCVMAGENIEPLTLPEPTVNVTSPEKTDECEYEPEDEDEEPTETAGDATLIAGETREDEPEEDD